MNLCSVGQKRSECQKRAPVSAFAVVFFFISLADVVEDFETWTA
jgi:hypothetical protein